MEFSARPQHSTQHPGNMRYEVDTSNRHIGNFGTASNIGVRYFADTSVRELYQMPGFPYQKGLVRPRYPTERYRSAWSCNTLPSIPERFSTQSIPVPYVQYTHQKKVPLYPTERTLGHCNIPNSNTEPVISSSGPDRV